MLKQEILQINQLIKWREWRNLKHCTQAINICPASRILISRLIRPSSPCLSSIAQCLSILHRPNLAEYHNLTRPIHDSINKEFHIFFCNLLKLAEVTSLLLCQLSHLSLENSELVGLQDLNHDVIQTIFYHHGAKEDDGVLTFSLLREKIICDLQVTVAILEISDLDVQSVVENHVGSTNLCDSIEVARLWSSCLKSFCKLFVLLIELIIWQHAVP